MISIALSWFALGAAYPAICFAAAFAAFGYCLLEPPKQ
jgi:hypothetical protein